MKHTFSIAALIVAGFSTSSMAGDKASSPSIKADALGAYSAGLSVAANSEQVRNLLRSQGYAKISQLNRDANGRWNGIATKDGERKLVAVSLPKRAEPTPSN